MVITAIAPFNFFLLCRWFIWCLQQQPTWKPGRQKMWIRASEGGNKGSLCKTFFLWLFRIHQKNRVITKINHSELRWTRNSTEDPFPTDLQLGMLWNGLLGTETTEQKLSWTWKCSQIRKEKKFPTKGVWRCWFVRFEVIRNSHLGPEGSLWLQAGLALRLKTKLKVKDLEQEVQRALQRKTKGNVCGTLSEKLPELFLSPSAKSRAEPRVRAPQNNEPRVRAPQNNAPSSVRAWKNVLLFCRRKTSPWNAQGVFSSISWYK